MIKNLIEKNRSYRRFDENKKISKETLTELVELARLSSSPMNLQSLKFLIVTEDKTNNKVFKTLKWAGALPDWDGPEIGERPTGYMIILGDTTLIPKGQRDFFDFEVGIWGHSVRLGATEKGIASCMIAAIDRETLKKDFNIDDKYKIAIVIAFGMPAEEIIIEPIDKTGNFHYHRDEQGRHFVPKRSLKDLILGDE